MKPKWGTQQNGQRKNYKKENGQDITLKHTEGDNGPPKTRDKVKNRRCLAEGLGAEAAVS